MDIKVGSVIDAKAFFCAKCLKPAREIDIVCEKVRRCWPIEGNRGAALRLIFCRIKAVSAPGIISLIGVRSEPQQDLAGTSRIPHNNLGNLKIADARPGVNEIGG